MEAAEAEGDQFPQLHAGAAHGPALRRWGDYYGGPVNLAARLTERARPGALIADAAVRELAGDEASRGRTRARSGSRGCRRRRTVWRCRRAA